MAPKIVISLQERPLAEYMTISSCFVLRKLYLTLNLLNVYHVQTQDISTDH